MTATGGEEPPPARVRITGPRPRHPRRTSVASEIDAQTELGEVYMRSLIRSQLRLAMGTVILLALSVGSLPLLFRLRPGMRTVEVLGIPLPWMLLGFLVYPFLLLLAWSYARRADRNEQRFRDLVGPR